MAGSRHGDADEPDGIITLVVMRTVQLPDPGVAYDLDSVIPRYQSPLCAYRQTQDRVDEQLGETPAVCNPGGYNQGEERRPGPKGDGVAMRRIGRWRAIAGLTLAATVALAAAGAIEGPMLAALAVAAVTMIVLSERIHDADHCRRTRSHHSSRDISMYSLGSSESCEIRPSYPPPIHPPRREQGGPHRMRTMWTNTVIRMMGAAHADYTVPRAGLGQIRCRGLVYPLDTIERQ